MAGRTTAEHRVIDVGDGLTLRAVIDGSGPPLVLLHGFTGSVETWRPLRAALGATRTVIAIDLPGHGASGCPADPVRYALPRVADDLRCVLDHLGIERTALWGYSLGGRVSLQFALRHADRLDALVLESASPGIADPVEREARRLADEALAASIERGGVEAFVDRWESLPMWESQRALSDEQRDEQRRVRLASSGLGLANSLRGAGAAAQPALGHGLARVAARSLIVAGALDTRYVASSRAMASEMPKARLVIVENCGHAVHLERPHELVRLVLEFLDG